MKNLDKLFFEKEKLSEYSESLFFKFDNNVIKTGLAKPVIFVANKKELIKANHFSTVPIIENDYDIHVIKHESNVLFYLIDVKAPFFKVHLNGIILRRRAIPQESDKEGVEVRYNFEPHFVVISNRTASASIFTRNVTADPTT